MAGRDRVIDPVAKDYVSDGKGGVQTTRDASTAAYHQIIGRLGKWLGDPTAGSEFFTLARAKNPSTQPQTIQNITNRAMQPLVDDERVTAPEFRQEQTTDRVLSEINITDIQSGESLDLLKLLPLLF